MKTAEDKQKDKCKWTTFLQKPNRPIPKTKEELAREKLPQYKVKIVKQPKPRGAPGREPTPPPVVEDEVIEQVVEVEEELLEKAPEEEIHKGEEIQIESQQPLTEFEIAEIAETTLDNEVPDLVNDGSIVAETVSGIPTDLERQLADVQKQLLALSNLPQAIQATLDAVTSELAKIVQVASKQASVDRDYRSKSLSRDIEPAAVTEETEMMVIEETVEERLELVESNKPVVVEDEEDVGNNESECSSQSESSIDCSSVMSTPAVVAHLTKEQQLEEHQRELREAIQNKRIHVSDQSRFCF